MPIVLRPPGLRTPLPARLAALGRARKRATLAAGAFALVGLALAAGLVACVLDASLHLPPLARAVALVVTLAASGVVWLRTVAPARRFPTAPLAVALDLEGRFPRLNDALASAVEFLDGPADGVSGPLRAAAVRRAERLAERHDFAALVPTGRCWRLFWACVGLAAVAAPLAALDPARAGTALARLADPFGAHPWPTKTRVEILSPEHLPTRLPKGDPFELRFAVRGVIPDRAAVAFRSAGEEFEDVFPLVAADPKAPAGLPPEVFARGPVAVVTARFDPGRLTHDFQFRVHANDADTGWQAVAVVPPPRLVPLDGRASPQISVVPPAYTGLPPVQLPDGASVVEVPLGSALTLRAAADVPLAGAVLAYQGDRAMVEPAAALAPLGWLNPLGGFAAKSLAEAVGADVPVTVSGDGKTLHAAFTPSISGMYVLRLTDETGLTGTRLLELRLTPDPAPTVALVRPAVGRDPLLLVPGASVPVHVTADDRLYAVRGAALEYRVGRDGRLRTLPLPDAVAALTGPAARLRPTQFEAAFPLPLAAFRRDDGSPVRAGDTVILRAAADDWDDVSVLKGPGRSGEVELRVASRESVEAFLQKETAALRPDLLRAREQQREAARKTDAAKPAPDGTLTPADREALLAAEQAQRQLRGKLADARDGLRGRAENLREIARANGLPRSDTTDRIERTADELAGLTDRLDAIEPLLGEARQQSARPSPAGQESPVPRLLTQAGRQQKAVEEGLTDLIDRLGQWGGAAEVRGDARLLRDAVTREAGAADRLPEKVPAGKAADALAPDQRAELERAAGRLDPLAEKASGLIARAATLAADKEKDAADARRAAEAKAAEAAGFRANAAALPPGSPEQRDASNRADAARTEAGEAQAAAKKADAEAAALRRAVTAAEGQALPDGLRRAADALRANRQSEAAALDRAAAARLDKLARALADPQVADDPETARRLKQAADQLDALAGAQEELRKRTAEAERGAGPEKRADDLKRLAAEQEKLLAQGRDLAQRLARDRADDAARDTRAALGKMESARDDLERGLAPAPAQQGATAKLDDARDKLDAAAAKAPRPDTDEALRKLTDQVQALLARQAAAAAEADRVRAEVAAAKKWSRPLVVRYADLEDRERMLAVAVRALGTREFADLPVFARVVKDAAGALDKAADAVKARVDDTDAGAALDPEAEAAGDARVRKPMALAARRLQQVLDALKPGNPSAKADGPQPAPAAGGPMSPMTPPAGGADETAPAVPPLAQVRALRALQTELNERTAEFARLHPDSAALTPDDRAELKELEDAQRDIATLFDQVAKQTRPVDGPPQAPTEEKP